MADLGVQHFRRLEARLDAKSWQDLQSHAKAAIYLGHPDFAAVMRRIRRTVVAAGTDFPSRRHHLAHLVRRDTVLLVDLLQIEEKVPNHAVLLQNRISVNVLAALRRIEREHHRTRRKFPAFI